MNDGLSRFVLIFRLTYDTPWIKSGGRFFRRPADEKLSKSGCRYSPPFLLINYYLSTLIADSFLTNWTTCSWAFCVTAASCCSAFAAACFVFLIRCHYLGQRVSWWYITWQCRHWIHSFGWMSPSGAIACTGHSCTNLAWVTAHFITAQPIKHTEAARQCNTCTKATQITAEETFDEQACNQQSGGEQNKPPFTHEFQNNCSFERLNFSRIFQPKPKSYREIASKAKKITYLIALRRVCNKCGTVICFRPNF